MMSESVHTSAALTLIICLLGFEHQSHLLLLLLSGSRTKITLHASACPCNASALAHRLLAVYNNRPPLPPHALPGAWSQFLESAPLHDA